MIYLDNAASTPIHPEVISAMIPFLSDNYGNPSSLHRSGRVTSNSILKSRYFVSRLIGSNTDEIYFTSGGTESNNLALIGYAKLLTRTNPLLNRIVTSTIEHDSILETLRFIEEEMKFAIDYVPVTKDGIIDIEHFSKAITSNTGIISIMLANNEIGTIQPIKQLVKIAKEKNSKIIFHTDAVQAIGKITVNVNELNIDMMSISSHKINGPKGVGALYIRHGIKPRPLIYGGKQEDGIRSGTENTCAIIGFGIACKIWESNFAKFQQRIKKHQKLMIDKINSGIPFSKLNGSATDRIPNNINFSFSGINGEELLIKLDEKGVESSTGSACSSNKKQKASHVLKALGLDHNEISSSIRLSIGYQNTTKDIELAVETLKDTIKELREANGFVIDVKQTKKEKRKVVRPINE